MAPQDSATKNEQAELEKIMSEIEEFQNEMINSPVVAAAASPEKDDILKEIQNSAVLDDSSLEDTLVDLKPTDATGDYPSVFETEETHMAGPSQNISPVTDGNLTLTLTGNMTLTLKYEFEGQEVSVSFADQALRVQMTDGTEFKIPVSRMTSHGGSGHAGSGKTSNVTSIKKTG